MDPCPTLGFNAGNLDGDSIEHYCTLKSVAERSGLVSVAAT